MDVLLDLWGVLTDSRKMDPAYRKSVAEILSLRHGGSADAWMRAHDIAAAWYSDHMRNQATWSQGTWCEVVERADAENLVRMFREMKIMPPEDPLSVERSLELEVMSAIDAAFPDARPAVARLNRAGHRLCVSTNATESNARGSLHGARLLEEFHDIFTGQRLNAGKATPEYWKRVREALALDLSQTLVVDDRFDYLEAATSVGIPALLLDRTGAHRPEAMPTFVGATLRNLAALPKWIEAREGSDGKVPRRTST